jgi:hypothetical protein
VLLTVCTQARRSSHNAAVVHVTALGPRPLSPHTIWPCRRPCLGCVDCKVCFKACSCCSPCDDVSVLCAGCCVTGRWKPLGYFVQRTFAPLAVHVLEAWGKVEVWGESTSDACTHGMSTAQVVYCLALILDGSLLSLC